jgi:hypothetical protein
LLNFAFGHPLAGVGGGYSNSVINRLLIDCYSGGELIMKAASSWWSMGRRLRKERLLVENKKAEPKDDPALELRTAFMIKI